MRQFIIVVVLGLIMLGNVSANKSLFPTSGGPQLTSSDKQNSIQFRSMQGSSRQSEFEKIQKLILPANPLLLDQPTEMGISPSTKSDIIDIMGRPDAITDSGLWEYSLAVSPNNCKVVIGFNKSSEVKFFTIKNCN